MMKSRLGVLITGELARLNKYNVFSISILVAIIWGLILFFMDEDVLGNLLPFVLLIDASLMSVMYIGTVSYFEKIESTISTLLVTPTTNGELVLSKVIANTIHNMLSSALIILVFYFIKDVDVNFFMIFFGILVVTTFFTIAGLSLSYYLKDFTTMLVAIMAISFALVLPTALYLFGVLSWSGWEVILLISPIQAAEHIISGGFNNYTFGYEYFVSLFYLGVGGPLLYKLHTLPKFQSYAIKQSGV